MLPAAAEKSPASHCTFLLPCAASVFSSGDPQNCVLAWGQVAMSSLSSGRGGNPGGWVTLHPAGRGRQEQAGTTVVMEN